MERRRQKLQYIGLLLGRCGSGTLLEAVGPAKFLAESLKATSSIHEFLLSGEKRVAIAANIDIDPGQGAARCKGVSACTVNRTGLISRMNFFFHGHYSFGWNVRSASHGRRQSSALVNSLYAPVAATVCRGARRRIYSL